METEGRVSNTIDNSRHVRMARTRKRACDSCYKRKIQCDASEAGSRCNFCFHHDLPCTYNRVRGRKKKASPRESIAKRLERIEEGIARTRASKYAHENPSTASAPTVPHPANTTQPSRGQGANQTSRSGSLSVPQSPSKAPLGQIYYSGRNFGAICPPGGIPYFTPDCEKWIHARTGQWPDFHSLDGGESFTLSRRTATTGSTPYSAPNPTSSSKAAELPEKRFLKSLFQSFLTSGFSLVFPLVERTLFSETIDLAYSTPDDTSSLEYIGAKACAFAFLTMASIPLEAQVSPHVDGDACAKQAQLLLADFLEDGSTTTLQAVLMLMLHEGHCGHIRAASMYHTVACRTVFALGGHTLASGSLDGRDLSLQELHDRHLRMLFWLCYVFDKDIALRSGKPPVICDEFCDLTLPEGYPEGVFVARRDRYAPEESPSPWLPSDLRLSLLKSKTIKALYSASSLKMSDAELLRTIRELDEELERWRLSIPQEFSPALSVRGDVKLVEDLNKTRNMLHIELYLDYHYLLSIIHYASSRCAGDRNGSDHEMSFGVQSSLELSVEASRSTVIYLSAAAPRLAEDAFWLYTFYPVNALMSLFFYILRSPHHEYAVHDMELLGTAAKIIRSMPIRRVTARETAYLRRMDSFVAEMNRLAKFAIEKWHDENANVP